MQGNGIPPKLPSSPHTALSCTNESLWMYFSTVRGVDDGISF